MGWEVEDMLIAQLDGTYHVWLNQTALVKEVTKASGADAVHANHDAHVWVG